MWQAPFDQVLRQIVQEMSADPEVSTVLFFFGSVQRGAGSPHSDLDFFVGTTGTTYQRCVREIGGVVAELFRNPVPRLRQLFAEEDGVAIHAFATGQVVFDRQDDGKSLAALARRIWRAGPRPLTAEATARWRYGLTALASDLEGMAADSAEARLIAARLVSDPLQAHCAFNRLWVEQPRHLVKRVGETAPDLAQEARQCCEAGMPPRLAVALADRVLRPVGGRLAAYASEPRLYTPGPLATP